MTKGPWYAEQDVTTLGTPGSLEYLSGALDDPAESSSYKGLSREFSGSPQGHVISRSLGRKKECGYIARYAFPSEKLREIGALGLPQKQILR